jgi:membrane protease YdiL (CAAX protease family)
MKSSIPALLKQHAFIVFVALAVLIAWFPWYTTGTGFLVFGPSIAGVITIALTGGKEGLRDLGQRALRWRVGILWWAVALFFTGLTVLPAIAINVALGGGLPSFAFFKQEWHLIPVYFLITMLGGPLGEEFGWRGFALPNLQRKRGPLVASIIIGVVWALWHLPQFLQPESFHAQIGLRYLPLYVVSEICLAIIITWVYNKTGGSLLVGGIILHNADNFWGVTLLTDATMTSVFQSGANPQLDVQLFIIGTIVSVLVVIILAWATKGRLGLSEDKAKDA